jgi:hypothetical protein
VREKVQLYTEMPPLDEKGKPKLKFEVKMRALGSNPKEDGVEKAVFVDGKKLDFKIDVLRFLEAKQKGINFLLEEQAKIEREFTKSVSEAIGRKVTKEDIKKATIEGWI